MARHRPPPPEELPPAEELPVDDLESVTEGLPYEEDGETGSLTPEEALAELLREPETEEEPGPNPGRRKRRRRDGESAPMPDELDDRVYARNLKEGHPFLRRVINVSITVALGLVIFVMILARVVDIRPLRIVENGVSAAMTPVQSAFASAAGKVTGYFRTLRLRTVLEEEYNRRVAENEELVYEHKLSEDRLEKLSQYEDMVDGAAGRLDPLECRVIGREEGNYFSTFTIDKGSAHGIRPYMAVTVNGVLLGYTETVNARRTTVRTIIDSEASVAGIIQSSRDQGTIRGTLGIDGTSMCRMYYLPEGHLPRPGDVVVTSGLGMSIPKGIPIGIVREATRGLEGSGRYVVVEPEADFEHIEKVTVLRYTAGGAEAQ